MSYWTFGGLVIYIYTLLRSTGVEKKKYLRVRKPLPSFYRDVHPSPLSSKARAIYSVALKTGFETMAVCEGCGENNAITNDNLIDFTVLMF